MTETKTVPIKIRPSIAERVDTRVPLQDLLLENKGILSLQSYEYFGDDSKVRSAQRRAFIGGEIARPKFEYPKIDPEQIQSMIRQYEELISEIYALELDPKDEDVILDTISYRMAEAYYLLSVKRSNQAYANGDTNTNSYLLETQDLNEQLYGVPDKELHSRIIGEFLAQVESKTLNPTQQKAFDELTAGFKVEAGGEVIEIPPMDFSSVDGRLPVFEDEVKEKSKSIAMEMYGEIYDVVDEYYETVVLTRPKEQQLFFVDDMIHLFNLCIAMSDPNNNSGVRVTLDKNSSSLAWSTPDVAVKVGLGKYPIESPGEMFSLLVHEFGKHAASTVNGFKYDNPILGMGIYTEADDGEKSDYLTFEEGLASLMQQFLDDKRQGWDFLAVGKQLAVGLAYEGLDYRQVYEILWRVKILLDGKENTEMDENYIKTAKNKAAMTCDRIFRGTPTEMKRVDSKGNPIIVTFNKDTSYLEGKIRAYSFLKDATRDEIMRYMTLKADPSNHYHRAAVAHITGYYHEQ